MARLSNTRVRPKGRSCRVGGRGNAGRTRASLLLWVLLLAAFHSAGAQEGILFDVPRQSADSALTAFARQAEIPVLFPFDRVRNVTANGLVGRYSVTDGLKILLVGTGLTGRVDERGQIVIDVNGDFADGAGLDGIPGGGSATPTKPTEGGPRGGANVQNRQPAAVLEEIVVTARLYEESIQDAPLSVGVLTDDYLIHQRVNRADDIMALTPGATYESFSKVQPVAAMRGVLYQTPGNSSSESSIQSVVDSVVITKDFMKSPPLFDMERIEVLRGPQGTAFGRNASVGLVHFVSRRPTRHFESGLNFSAGSDELVEVDGFVSSALSDAISGRFAFNFDEQDGPTESISTGEGLDGDSNTAIRGSLLIEPNDAFSAYLKLEFSEDDDEAPVRHGDDCSFAFIDGPRATVPWGGFYGPVDPRHPPYPATVIDDCDPFKTEISEGEFFLKREITTASAELSLRLDEGLTVTSVTGFMAGENDALADVLGTSQNIVWQQVQNDGESFSTELRVDNHAVGNGVRWMAGVYLMNDEEDRFEENQFFQDGALPFPRVPSFLATISSNETDSVSIFGELSIDLGDRTNVTVGGRYIEDEKDYLYSVRASGFRPVLSGVEGCTPEVGIICGSRDNPVGFAPIPVSNEWDDFIGKISVQRTLRNGSMVYGLFSEGFKSGGFQADARDIASARVSYNEEESKNFELGWKVQSDRARYGTTLFFMQNEGNQVINLVPVGSGFTGLITNVGTIMSKGIEFDGTWLVTEDFLLGGNAAVMDAELEETSDPDGNDISGQRPPGAPDWTATLYSEYEFHLGRGSRLTLRADYRGRSDVFNELGERPSRARLRPSRGDWGMRITWENASASTRVSLWGKNLNEDYDIENFGPRQPNTLQLPTGFRGKTAYGVSLRFEF